MRDKLNKGVKGRKNQNIKRLLAVALLAQLALVGIPASAFAEAMVEDDAQSQRVTADLGVHDEQSQTESLLAEPMSEGSQKAGSDLVAEGVVETESDTEGISIHYATLEPDHFANQVYTGEEIKPKVTLRYLDRTLQENVDYKISYSNNVEPGTGRIIIEGIGEFIHTRSVNFQIVKRAVTINGTEYTQAASGNGSNGGTWSWDGNTSMVLDGYSGGALTIKSDKMDIELRGTNSITDFSGYDINENTGSRFAIRAEGGAVRLFGSGSLSIDAGSNAVNNKDIRGISAADLTVDGTTMSMDLSKIPDAGFCESIWTDDTLVVCKGARVAIKGGTPGKTAVYATVLSNHISVLDSTLEVVASNDYAGGALYFYDALRIENSRVTTPGQSGFIFTFTGKTTNVVNSDIDALTFEHAGATASKVVGATDQKHRSVGGIAREFAPDPETGRVRILHTGAASAYPNGVGGNTRNCWAKTGGKWYYYGANGTMTRGWQNLGGKWYYLDPSTFAMKTGWIKSGSTWYYLRSSGVMATGWTKVGSTWYYFSGSGAMKTGWIKSGSTWYYLKDTGAMAVGWAKVGSDWYYFNSSGVMKTGWLKLGNNWYYFNGSGAMVTGRQNIGGKWYTFNSSGAWVG